MLCVISSALHKGTCFFVVENQFVVKTAPDFTHFAVACTGELFKLDTDIGEYIRTHLVTKPLAHAFYKYEKKLQDDGKYVHANYAALVRSTE